MFGTRGTTGVIGLTLMKLSFLRRWIKFLAVAASLLAFWPAQADEVAIAGFAFAGDFTTAPQRFPYTYKVFQRLHAGGSVKNLSREVFERVSAIHNDKLEFLPADKLVNLKHSDQALMTTLVLTGETTSTENFGSYYKTFVNLRGDALIFDYKSQTVVRSYPVSVVLFDATPDQPDDQRFQGFVEQLLLRPDASGLMSQFVKRLSEASLPQPGTRNIQVKSVTLTPEALAIFPKSMQVDPHVPESMLADTFGSILSAKLGVPMLPNAIGHSAGVMSLRLENGDDFNLKLGTGDYLFDLKFTKFAKIEKEKNNVATQYVYGAFANVHFYDPSLNTDYINSDFKNGELAVVPSDRIGGDDFNAYQDAMRNLYVKLADAIAQKDSKWINAAASAKDIATQLDSARDIIRKCK